MQPKTQSQLILNKWYQYPEEVFGDFVTALNPDQRLFWSLVPSDLIINQRLTVFKLKDEIKYDKRLIHALLNSYFGQFMIEATGFGRGLGVLDTTKDRILDSVMLNFNLLTPECAKEIIDSWINISQIQVPNILDQLNDEKWMNFNKLVFGKFCAEEILEELIVCFREAIEL